MTKEEAVQIAERIVIEYAKLSGRDTDTRAFVREAVLTVLPDFIRTIREKDREAIREFVEKVKQENEISNGRYNACMEILEYLEKQ